MGVRKCQGYNTSMNNYMVGIAHIQKRALIDRKRFPNGSSFKEIELH